MHSRNAAASYAQTQHGPQELPLVRTGALCGVGLLGLLPGGKDDWVMAGCWGVGA